MNDQFWDRLNTTMLDITGGFTTPEQCEQMAREIFAKRPALSVEIGVWRGTGLIALAMAHKHMNYGKVIGIDPWSADAYPKTGTEPLEKLGQKDWDDTYKFVLDCIRKTDTTYFVELRRAKSDDIPPPEGIGFLRIDGDHGAASMRDVTRFCPNVLKGGLLHLDDINWAGGSGELGALDYLARNGWAEEYRTPTGAAYRKN